MSKISPFGTGLKNTCIYASDPRTCMSILHGTSVHGRKKSLRKREEINMQPLLNFENDFWRNYDEKTRCETRRMGMEKLSPPLLLPAHVKKTCVTAQNDLFTSLHTCRIFQFRCGINYQELWWKISETQTPFSSTNNLGRISAEIFTQF